MIKKSIIIFAAILLTFVSSSYAYGTNKIYPDSQDAIVKFINDSVYFSRGLDLVSCEKDTQSGEIKFIFENKIKPFKSLYIYYNAKDKKIDFMDYYVDVFTSGNMNLPVKYSEKEAIKMAYNDIKQILGPDYVFSDCINDDDYIDNLSPTPYIYKFIFKKTVNSIPADSREIVIYIDSNSGNVVRFVGKNLSDDTKYEKVDSIKIKNDEAYNLYKKYFNPQLIYYKDYNDDFPEYKIGYIATINNIMYGIDAENGDVVDYKGDVVKNEIIDLTASNVNTRMDKSKEVVTIDGVKSIADEFVKMFKINQLRLIQSNVINKFYATGRSAHVFNFNLTEKNDKIVNLNIAIDTISNRVVQQNFNYWNYKEDNFERINSPDMAIDLVKKYFYDKLRSLVFLKYPINGTENSTYIFYRKYNGAVIFDNYISIEVDKKGVIKNISMNWSDINIPSEDDIIGYDEALNIFLSSGLDMRYIITDDKKGKLIYVPQSMKFIVDAKTGKKIFYESFVNYEE